MTFVILANKEKAPEKFSGAFSLFAKDDVQSEGKSSPANNRESTLVS